METHQKKTLDVWLYDKGFYRKHIALDETCFFRAVSDQVYNTQVYHENIRLKCINYANRNRNLFQNILGDEEWDSHMDDLLKHLIVCTNIEVQIVSRMMQYDFIIIDGTNLSVENTTNYGYKKFITLCKLKDNHYDSVYRKEFIENSGFCQSLIYKMLYEEIFELGNTDDIVNGMLNTEGEDFSKKSENNTNIVDSLVRLSLSNVTSNDIFNDPPFPYKVAKALDPNQYRNIEFDAWNQTRKEIRMKDWYLGGDDLKIGTKCLLVAENNTFECYIQDLKFRGDIKDCLVYVIEWAQKQIVNRDDLLPLPNAQPWPLPFSISRNIKNVPAIQEVKTVNKKVKKQNKNSAKLSNSSPPVETNNNEVIKYSNSLEGRPLITPNANQLHDTGRELNISNITSVSSNEPTFEESSCVVPFEGMTCSNQCEPFNMFNSIDATLDCMKQNSWPVWIPNDNIYTPVVTPYSLPDPNIHTFNPQMSFTSHQYNTFVHHQQDNKFTVFSEIIKETINLNNNNISLSNLNGYMMNNYEQKMDAPMMPVQAPPCTCCPQEIVVFPCCPSSVPSYQALPPEPVNFNKVEPSPEMHPYSYPFFVAPIVQTQPIYYPTPYQLEMHPMPHLPQLPTAPVYNNFLSCEQ